MKTCLVICALATAAAAADFPQAEISNGTMQVKFYLPDARRGYYRGTRFDWSGQIYSLRYSGHEYFGQWFEKYDPKLHDAIMGPVEEFRSGSLGYDEAKAGGTFVRIGVGVVRKPRDEAFQPFHTYDIVDAGEWSVRRGRDRIEFTHRLRGPAGYAYVYRKTVRLVKGKPEMIIAHSLKNTGARVIETNQYNHNFFVIDRQPSGPDVTVRFPFELKPVQPMRGPVEPRGRELVYLKEVPPGESAYGEFAGFGTAASDYDIRVEHRKAGAGVRITGDRPLSKVVFWSIRTTPCAEPYIQLRVEPGREEKWSIRYRFYTLTSAAAPSSGRR